MKTVLSIAGTDPTGGAGIQADIKTMTMNGVYAMSAVTAMVAQNTTGVMAIQDSTPEFLAQQLDAVFEDIFPDAVKIGMVSSCALIDVIADRLHRYNAKKYISLALSAMLDLGKGSGPMMHNFNLQGEFAQQKLPDGAFADFRKNGQ